MHGIKRLTRSSAHQVDWSKSILYLDPSLIVLNKPPGLVCQPGEGTRGASSSKGSSQLYDFQNLLEELKNHLSLSGLPYPVHRLDKGTSGSLILARSVSAARQISLQFQQDTVHKTYLALVRGGEKTFGTTSGEIRVPINYVDGRACLHVDGKPSSTNWKLVASSSYAPISLVRLQLLTGHKHQLRVHLAHSLRAPILGDTVYSKSSISDSVFRFSQVPEDRIFLHASEVSLLKYKKSGSHKQFRLGVRAPLPTDFLKICEDLNIKVDEGEAQGGLLMNGEFVENGTIPEVSGQWVPGKTTTQVHLQQ